MVGTIEPRKGYDFALKVFECIWSDKKNEAAVIIVGKAGWKTEKLQRELQNHPKAGTSLFWLKDIDDGQLNWLYGNSVVLFSTSFAEGFGLPLTEARSHGLPVVATDLPVFREFDEAGMVFFELGDVRQAARLLENALKGDFPPAGAASLQSATWEDTAKDILRRVVF